MSLPEKKVKELIALMNSKSTASVPAAKQIVAFFEEGCERFRVNKK